MTFTPATSTDTSPSTTEELDFAQLTQTPLRRWPWIVLNEVSELLIAGWITRNSKPVLVGEHQIVMHVKDKGGGGISQNSVLAGLAGISVGKSELISTPTLQDALISPRPARNLALGLLAGLGFGSFAALIADRRIGLIFSIKELQQELPGPLLAELQSPADATLQLVARGPLADASTVGLITLGIKPEAPLLLALQEHLQQLMPQAAVLPCVDAVAASTCSHCLLVTQLGAASRTELKRLRQQLQLHPQPLAGWLLLGTSNDC